MLGGKWPNSRSVEKELRATVNCKLNRDQQYRAFPQKEITLGYIKGSTVCKMCKAILPNYSALVVLCLI